MPAPRPASGTAGAPDLPVFHFAAIDSGKKFRIKFP
jgi:hypothetical protein